MEKTKKEMKNKINWAVGLSVVAVIFSIFSFFISEGTLKFDSVNFIIGVLAILVTFLLGWQIYNVVGVKRELEKFEEKINGYKTEINTIIDKKVTESERKIEYENFQNLARISFEFYGQFNFSLSNVELNIRLPLLMGAIIYGSYVENMNEEISQLYETVINIFEEILRNNENEIRAMDDQMKENLLRKTREFTNIFEFRELRRILESE